ncbi:MAG: TerB family tellurite resistance protein [Maribacter sp.]
MDTLEKIEHRRHVVHFAQLVNLAKSDGQLELDESIILERLAQKLDIPWKEYDRILENSTDQMVEPLDSLDKKYEYIYDFFKIIFADNRLDEEEYGLVLKYIYALGFKNSETTEIIKRTVAIFEEGISLRVYKRLILGQ